MQTNLTKQEIVSLAIEIVIKVFILGVILYISYSMLKPFAVIVLWAIIIAVTLYPLVLKLERKYQLKRNLIVVSITIFAILALIAPTYKFSESLYGASEKLVVSVQEGTLQIPAPSEKIKTLPVVGEKVYAFAQEASEDITETLNQYQSEIKTFISKAAMTIGSVLGMIVQFIVALIIAAIFLSNSEKSIKASRAISKRLVGEQGIEWVSLSAQTIRSVVQGVIGIALIQATLALIGLVAIDVPFAVVWALVVLFLAIIQLPPLLILGPIIAYVFSYADTTPATIFAVYSVLVSMSDGFLKPFLLGRGVDIPMLVILLGAIGGMILFGILGLFVGAVILALAYKLFMVWLEQEH